MRTFGAYGGDANAPSAPPWLRACVIHYSLFRFHPRFFLCWRANLLSWKRTPVTDLSMNLLGYPRAFRRSLKFERHSSKVVCEEFVLRSLVASPLIKPRFTPGLVAGGEMRVLEGFCRLVVGLDVPAKSLKFLPITKH